MEYTRIKYKGFHLDFYYDIEEEEKQTLYHPHIDRELMIYEIWLNGSNVIELLLPQIEELTELLEKELKA
jgi:hypothetical protein